MKNSEILSRFHINFPYLVDFMKKSDHNYSSEQLNPYHLEGDVWSHTMMVFNQASSNDSSSVVRIAALLHDIGKPHCKKINDDTKRVSFFNHEAVSFFMAKDVLKKCYPELSEKKMKDCLYLIANHSILFPRNNQELTADSALNLVSDKKLLKQLIELVECDSTGRIIDVTKDGGDDFSDSLFDIYYSDEMKYSASKAVINQDQKVLTLLIGLPGSGKSYWNEHNTYQRNTTVVSRDETMMRMGEFPTNYHATWETADHKAVDKEVNRIFQSALKDGDDIVIDKTNLTRKGRRKYINEAKRKGYRIEAKIFVPGFATIKERQEDRENNKVISDKVLERMVKSFSFPLDNEVDDWKIIF